MKSTLKKVIFLNRFEKDYAKMIKRGKDPERFGEVLNLLRSSTKLPAKYRDHKLTGSLKDMRDLHIEPDWLLLYQVTQEAVICVRMGTHSDLF